MEYVIHPFTNIQEARKFVESHETSFITLFPENIPGKFSIYVTLGNEIIGYSMLSDTDRGLIPTDTKVKEEHRRKGLATKMYQEMEKLTGKKIAPSDNQTEDAKNLWKQSKRSFGSMLVETKKTFEPSPEKPFVEVIRIENVQGQGPYAVPLTRAEMNNNWKRDWEDDSNHLNKMSKVPREDGFTREDLEALDKDKLQGGLKFGFKSLEQLRGFFSPSEIEKLLKKGFQVKRLKASEVWEGKSQLFFKPFNETTHKTDLVAAASDTSATLQTLKSTFPELAKAAQGVYDNWTQEEGEYDPYNGGGICHDIADAMCTVLDKKGIPCSSVSSSHEQHVYVAVQLEEGTYSVDIYHGNYETGGGFTWKKIPDVTFSPEMITIYRVGEASDFEEYIGSSVEATFRDKPKTWVHYSKIPEIKINPQTMFRDPAGIYLFPQDFTPIGNWTKFPYKFEVTPKEGMKVLDLGEITEVEMQSIYTHFFPGETFEIKKPEYTSLVDFWWEKLAERMVGKSGEFNKKFRELGFDAIFDDTGAIHSAEEQLIVLNPTMLGEVKRIENTSTGFTEVAGIMTTLMPLAESFGEVTTEGPLKKKALYAKKPTMQGTLKVTSGNNSATWDILVSEVEKGLGLPHHISLSLRSSHPDIKFAAGRSFGHTFNFTDWKKSILEAEREFTGAMDKIFAGGEVTTAADTGNIWYHLTDNPRFKLDPNYAPQDNAFHLADRSGIPGIYLSQSVETWVNGHNYWRPFVAEFEVDPSVKEDEGVHGRYGGELFVPATSFNKIKLLRVIPLDAHAREEFGSYGWIENGIGREFDTDKPLDTSEVYPFRDYKYSGPDVRSMSGPETTRLKKMLKIVKGSSEGKVEARKQRGLLYHFTTPEGMLRIAQDGFELRTVNREQISFTRNGALKFKPSADARDPEDGDSTGNSSDVTASVRITIDGDKLSDKYKMTPYTDEGFKRQGPLGSEAEEIIKKTEVYMGDCIYQVDVLDFSYEEEYGLEYAYQDEALPEAINLFKTAGHEVNKVNSFHSVWAQVTSAKQVGELYHMTSIGQLFQMGESDFKLYSNRGKGHFDQKHISFSRNPRLAFNAGESEEDDYQEFNCNCRIVIDGDKLTTKHSTIPFADVDEGPGEKRKQGASKYRSEYEQIVFMDKGASTLDIKPFIKRVDIYDDPTIPNFMEKYLQPAIKELDRLGIPYKMVPKFYGAGAPRVKPAEVSAALNVDFHTIMLDFNECASEKDFNFRKLQGMIPMESVFEEHPYQTDFPDGREQQPHVTVLFGLIHEHDLFPIRKYIATQPPIKFSIGNVTAFRNDDKPYDVLVIEIQSDDLQRIHWWIRDNFECDIKFPDYKSHMTLAYVKKGTCTELEGSNAWVGANYKCSNLKFSHKDNMMFDMPLNGNKDRGVKTLGGLNEPSESGMESDLHNNETSTKVKERSVSCLTKTKNHSAEQKSYHLSQILWKQPKDITMLGLKTKQKSLASTEQKVTSDLSTQLSDLSISNSDLLRTSLKTYLQDQKLPASTLNEVFQALETEPLGYFEQVGPIPSSYTKHYKRYFVRFKLDGTNFRILFEAYEYENDPILHLTYVWIRSRDSDTYSHVLSKGPQPKFNWKYREEDDGLKLIVYDLASGKEAGYATVNPIHSDMYEDEFTPVEQEHPSFEELTAWEYVISLQSLHVEDEFRGQGLSKKILNLILDKVKKRYPDYPLYLNASPFGHDKYTGLSLHELVDFYKRAGFKVLNEWGDNTTMWMESPKEIRTVARTFAEITPANRVEAAKFAEELPEGSDLKDFYELADRGSWEEQTQEEAEAEWSRLEDYEKEDVKQEMVDEWGESAFENQSEETIQKMIHDRYVSEYIRREEEDSNSSTTMFDKAHLGKNVTLVRFTDVPPAKMLHSGFQSGYKANNLGLTTLERPQTDGTLLFAFAKKDLKTAKDWKDASSNYGKYGYEFKVPLAVRAWHISDYEWQCIFDYTTATPLKQVWPKGKEHLQSNLVEATKNSKNQLEALGYVFSHELADNSTRTPSRGDDFSVFCHFNDEMVGSAAFHYEGRLVPSDDDGNPSVIVSREHQRKGIASAMYEYASELTGVSILPSEGQTDEGKAFWKSLSSTKPVAVNFIGSSVSGFEKALYTTYINYLCTKFGISPKKVTIRSLADQKGNRFGYVGDIKNRNNVKINIVIGSPWITLSRIAHEMTHIKQQLNNELAVDAAKNMKWKGAKFISVDDYNQLGNTPANYKGLPWEKEAYALQETLPKEFLKSDELYELANTEVPFVNMKAFIKELYEGTKVIASTNPFEDAYSEYVKLHADNQYQGYRVPSGELYEELKKEIGSFATQDNLVYRAVTAPSETEINFDKIGIYWSYKKEGARVYWGDHEGNHVFVITAKINPEDIDWLGTIEAYTKMVYSGEEEIRLKDRAEIEVVKIEMIEDNESFDTGLSPMRATAEVTT